MNINVDNDEAFLLGLLVAKWLQIGVGTEGCLLILLIKSPNHPRQDKGWMLGHRHHDTISTETYLLLMLLLLSPLHKIPPLC